jgi:hypothetical protein
MVGKPLRVALESRIGFIDITRYSIGGGDDGDIHFIHYTSLHPPRPFSIFSMA